MDKKKSNIIEVDLMYEGKDRDVFLKVLEHKYGGDKSVRSQISVVFYTAMYDALEVLKPSVFNGDTAAEAVSAITSSVANMLVGINVNIFPPEIRKSVMEVIMMGLMANVPEFLENTIEAMDDKEEKEKNSVKN